MIVPALRSEEIIALCVAIVLHVAIVALMILRPAPEPVPLPQRVTVSLAQEVGLEAASPEPVSESREAVAPTLSETPAPPPVQPQIDPPASRPAAVTPSPQQASSRAPRRRPDRPASRPRPKPRQAVPARSRQGGGSRIGSDFLPGAGSSADTAETRAPAAAFGRAEQAALAQAINRQLKPHWRAPQGLETERLVTVLTWRMNPDGSLANTPTVVRQAGITDANRAQAQIHAERAIRAVQLAAPFNLPEQFYDRWKYIRDWRFDRRL